MEGARPSLEGSATRWLLMLLRSLVMRDGGVGMFVGVTPVAG